MDQSAGGVDRVLTIAWVQFTLDARASSFRAIGEHFPAQPASAVTYSPVLRASIVNGKAFSSPHKLSMFGLFFLASVSNRSRLSESECRCESGIRRSNRQARNR